MTTHSSGGSDRVLDPSLASPSSLSSSFVSDTSPISTSSTSSPSSASPSSSSCLSGVPAAGDCGLLSGPTSGVRDGVFYPDIDGVIRSFDREEELCARSC